MQESASLLPADWNIPEKLRHRLGPTAGRQRILVEDGHLLVVLHAVPGPDETGRRGRFFWRDPIGTWRAAPADDRVSTLENHIAEYQQVIEHLERGEDDAKLARDFFELLDHLAPLARATRNMFDVLQQVRESLPTEREIIVLRDQAGDLMRRAELLREDSRNGLEFAIAWQAEQQAETSYQMSVAAHRLNLLVAFFFPIATLMAIFGTNLKTGLEKWNELAGPLPLFAVLAAGLLCGVILTGFVTRPIRRPQRGLQKKPSDSAG
jgi:hypothetical protein